MSSSPTLPEQQSIEIDRRTLAWRETGRGDPLVLVHGIGGYSGSWGRQLDAFADKFRVVAWDAPGYGGSAGLASLHPRIDDYASALASLLDALNVRTPHLVGHSLGSIMIASLCKTHGVAPRSMTLLQPVLGAGHLPENERKKIHDARANDMRALGPREFALQRGRTILSKSAPPDVVTEATEVMVKVPQDGYLAAWDMMCATQLMPLLDPQYPTMIVCGSDDPVCPPATGKSVADRMPGAALHVFEGVGHYAAIEAHDRFNTLLRAFISSHAGPG
jgi:pimeloyl-ACP methyl ester carboxylesterase